MHSRLRRLRAGTALAAVAVLVAACGGVELYRAALRLRRSHPALGDGTLRWLDVPEDVLAFAREPGFGCLVNISDRPVPLPAGAGVLLASHPLDAGDPLPPDATVWLDTGNRRDTVRQRVSARPDRTRLQRF
jgi:hypothetical protein